MKPPDIGAAKRGAILAQRCNIAHRPDLMQQYAVMLLRGAKRDIPMAEQPEPKVKQ